MNPTTKIHLVPSRPGTREILWRVCWLCEEKADVTFTGPRGSVALCGRC